MDFGVSMLPSVESAIAAATDVCKQAGVAVKTVRRNPYSVTIIAKKNGEVELRFTIGMTITKSKLFVLVGIWCSIHVVRVTNAATECVSCARKDEGIPDSYYRSLLVGGQIASIRGVDTLLPEHLRGDHRFEIEDDRQLADHVTTLAQFAVSEFSTTYGGLCSIEALLAERQRGDLWFNLFSEGAFLAVIGEGE